MQEMQVQSLGQEDPLEKGMTTHYIILGQRSLEGYTPWGRRVRHELATCPHGAKEKGIMFIFLSHLLSL